MVRGQILPSGIGPLVFGGAGHVKRPRRDQGQQRMLVKGQGRLAVVVGLERPAEPMGENRVDSLRRLAKPAPGQRRPAFARIVGNHEREPLVLRSRPERRFAQPRVAVHRDSPRIDVAGADQIVRDPAQAPRPRPDRVPIRRARLPGKQRRHRVAPSIRPVGKNIAVVSRHHRVAPADHLLDLPAGGLISPRPVRGAVSHHAFFRIIPHPRRR